MKIVVSSSELLKKLNVISKVINSKNTLHILDNFLFSIRDEKLTVSASDLDSTLLSEVPMERSEGEGDVAIPSQILLNILKELPEQPLTFDIDLEESNISLLSVTGKYSIYAESGSEFPKPQSIEEAEVKRLTSSSMAFFMGIEKSILAVATDDLRPVMKGISIIVTPEETKFAASDTHKLVRYKRTDIESEISGAFILPPKPATILKSILLKNPSDLTIEFDRLNARFKNDDYELVCRLYEGNYPAYEGIIPQEFERQIKTNRLELYQALKRVSLFSNKASKLVKLSIANDEITVSCQDTDFAISGTEKAKCTLSGEPIIMGFRADLLQELISNISAEEIEMKFIEPSRPGIITPTEQENEHEDILMLLMPMMVKS